MRHLDSRYGTNPAIVPGATQKNTNDPSTAPTVLVTPLLPHHALVFAERCGSAAARFARRRLDAVVRRLLWPSTPVCIYHPCLVDDWYGVWIRA